MKKTILLITVLALCTALILPAYAADAFVPSITYKGEPELVPSETVDPDTNETVSYIGIVREEEKPEDVISYVKSPCILITPVAEAATSEQIPDDAKELLLEVYDKLSSGEMKLPYESVEGIAAEDMVIMELLDISWLCGTPDGDDHPTQVAPEGIVFDLTFDLGVAVDAKIVIMSYHNGQWAPIVSVENNRDGTVTGVFEHLCPVAICIENSEPVDGPSQTGDTAQIGLWIAIMAVALVAIVFLLVLSKKKAKK